MTQQLTTQQSGLTNRMSMKDFFAHADIKAKCESLLGKRAPQFIASVLQIASSNSMLVNAEPASVLNAAMVAATLDLPLNNNLGFAYIVPYNNRQPDGSNKVVAQFQIGYKGFIQLAQRSGQFRTISACPVYEGQIKENNPLTGIVFDFNEKKSDVVIGYASYFELINGFHKTLYMTVADLKKHGQRFSKTFDNKNGLWSSDFETMALKTVIKQLLSKYAPLSIEMQKAVITDQAQIIDTEASEVQYPDNEYTDIDKENERIYLMIQDADSVKALEKILPNVPEELKEAYDFKLQTLQANGSK